MKKDYNNYRKEKQRFSIVKVSGKTTSVLVGLTIFGGLLLDAPNAQADTTPSYEVASDTSSSTTATNSKEVTLSSTTDKSNQVSDQTVSSTSNEGSQASATSVDNNEASSTTSTTNNVATSDASTTSSDATVANNTNTTANDATNSSTTDNTAKVRTKRAVADASPTTNYNVDDIYDYYIGKGATASKQKFQDLIDYKNNMSSVTAILNLDATSYGVDWVDQTLNKDVPYATYITDSFIDKMITRFGNQLVTTTNSKIDDQITKLTELQQKYPNNKKVENAIEKLNEAKNSVTLENVYNAEKMKDVIDTLNKYVSVPAYDRLEEAAKNEQTSGSGELDNAKTDAKAAIDKLENLNDKQKAAAKETVDKATTTADVTTAQNAATGLDNDMSGLKNSVSDVDATKNGENYTNASEEAKKVYDEAVSNAQAILDKAGNSATSDEVAAAKKAVEDAKAGLDGTSNLSNAKKDAQAAIDKLENLNDAQKAGFIADVDAASSQQLVGQAVVDVKALDSEMAKLRQEVELSNQAKDTTKYANSSDTLKKNYDDLLAVATALVSKNGIDANLATIQQLVGELKAARLALNGVDKKVETNTNTNSSSNVNKAKDSLSNKATSGLKTTSLPQTGETKENTSLVGAMLATIGGVLGLGLARRKKEDK